MNIEKIVGVLLILYGINIVYKASKHNYAYNKESWYVYQFKDYFTAFLIVLGGVILVFSRLTFKELFD